MRLRCFFGWHKWISVEAGPSYVETSLLIIEKADGGAELLPRNKMIYDRLCVGCGKMDLRASHNPESVPGISGMTGLRVLK